MTHRLFTATFIDNSLFENIYPGLKDDFRKACTGKWVERENLHFTYQFIGDTETNKANEMKEALGEYLKHYDSVLDIGILGAFPNPRKPRVLFIGISNPDGFVQEINTGMEKILRKFGYHPDHSKFSPHVTLLRVKTFEPVLFEDAFMRNKSLHAGSMPGFEVRLIESKLTPLGPVYKFFKIFCHFFLFCVFIY